MGCDIHQKTLVWSKVEKKYVDCHEIKDYDYEFDEWWPELFGGRCYDVFAVLGGVRGNRFQLYSEKGMPEKGLSRTFKKAYEVIGYHSSVSYGLNELEDKLTHLCDHIKKMKEKYLKLKKKYPKKWMDHWSDDWDYGKEDSDPYDEYNVFIPEDDDCLLAQLEEILKKLKNYYHFEYPDDWMQKLIDPEKTIIYFYFDS